MTPEQTDRIKLAEELEAAKGPLVVSDNTPARHRPTKLVGFMTTERLASAALKAERAG